MPMLAWITSCRQAGCGLARALVAGYLLDAPPAEASPEAVNDVAPELATLTNWGRMVPREEPRPYLVRTFLLPSAEVLRHYRDITAKVVYVARDPRAMMTDMLRGGRVRPEDRGRRLAQLLAGADDALRDSAEPHGNWQLHAREWTATQRLRQHFPRLREVLVLRYEEVADDPAGALGRLVDFLELPGGRDEERVRRAVAHWTPAAAMASGIFETPPGLREFRPAPPARMGRPPEPSATGNADPQTEAAYRDRIAQDAEFAALVRQFGYDN